MLKNDKMDKVVSYYLGDVARSVSKPALAQLADRLDQAGYGYWCFWAFVLNKYEPRKIIHRNFIESQLVWSEFLSERAKAPDLVRVRTAVAMDKIRAECSIKDPVKVFSDPSFMAEPVAKYVICDALGLDEAKSGLAKIARQQLLEEPEFFNTLAGFGDSLNKLMGDKGHE